MAMVSAISSLIYSEYVRTFKQVLKPIPKIFVAETSYVGKLLAPQSEFGNCLSDTMIDTMADDPLFRSYYEKLDDLSLFRPDKIEYLKTIFELYMLPRISASIPAVIRMKFGLDDPAGRQFIESGDIDLFNRTFPTKDHIQFAYDQAVLQLLLMVPGIPKSVVPSERNDDIVLPNADHEVLSIANEQVAISVIHFNKKILDCEPIRNLLTFVTQTHFTATEDGKVFKVITSPYNQAILTTLSGPVTVSGGEG
jgi:hypothetical protein